MFFITFHDLFHHSWSIHCKQLTSSHVSIRGSVVCAAVSNIMSSTILHWYCNRNHRMRTNYKSSWLRVKLPGCQHYCCPSRRIARSSMWRPAPLISASVSEQCVCFTTSDETHLLMNLLLGTHDFPFSMLFANKHVQAGFFGALKEGS